MPGSSGLPRITGTVLVGVVVALLMAACGGDDDGSSTTGAPSSASAQEEDVCQDAEALRSAVDELKDVDLAAEGTNAAKSAISAVKDSLAAFGESASDELQPQVQAVRDDLDEVDIAVENMESDGAAAALQSVSDLASSASDLVGSLEDGACD